MRLGTPPWVLVIYELQLFHSNVYVSFGRVLIRTNFSALTLLPGQVVEIVAVLSTKMLDSKGTIVSVCRVAERRYR